MIQETEAEAIATKVARHLPLWRPVLSWFFTVVIGVGGGAYAAGQYLQKSEAKVSAVEARLAEHEARFMMIDKKLDELRKETNSGLSRIYEILVRR